MQRLDDHLRIMTIPTDEARSLDGPEKRRRVHPPQSVQQPRSQNCGQ